MNLFDDNVLFKHVFSYFKIVIKVELKLKNGVEIKSGVEVKIRT